MRLLSTDSECRAASPLQPRHAPTASHSVTNSQRPAKTEREGRVAESHRARKVAVQCPGQTPFPGCPGALYRPSECQSPRSRTRRVRRTLQSAQPAMRANTSEVTYIQPTADTFQLRATVPRCDAGASVFCILYQHMYRQLDKRRQPPRGVPVYLRQVRQQTRQAPACTSRYA